MGPWIRAGRTVLLMAEEAVVSVTMDWLQFLDLAAYQTNRAGDYSYRLYYEILQSSAEDGL